MKEFIAACVQIAVKPNDVKANLDKAVRWLDKAANEHDADLVVFPETYTTGFDPAMDAFALWDLVDTIPGRVT